MAVLEDPHDGNWLSGLMLCRWPQPGPATTRASRAGLQSVRSKPALFLARGIRSGGLADGPAGWGRNIGSAPNAVVRLSVPALTGQSRRAGRASPAPRHRDAASLVDRAGRRVLSPPS